MKKGIFILFAIGVIAAFLVLQKSAETVVTSTPSPSASSEITNNFEELNWESYEFPEVGLSFSAPFEMAVTGEMLDETTFNLYVERSSYPNDDYYQLYGMYNLSAKDVNKDDLKTELDPDSIEETTINGFQAVKGQYIGERPRFVTFIITNRGLLTVHTSQPTEVNRQLTDTILSTLQID